jgi:DMSO/TMAO reductase YedYZ molybdopterin-dependent catalytic subunit
LASTAVAAGAAVAGGWYASRTHLGVSWLSRLSPGAPLALTPDGKLLDTDFPDPFAGGEFLGYLQFQSEGGAGELQPGIRNSAGHNARRIIDPATLLLPESRRTPADQFFIRTEYPDQLQASPDWTIKLHGEVKQAQDVPLKKLLPSVESKGPVLLECSGNAREQLRFGLLSVGEWAGIPIEKVLKLAQPTSKAKAILVNGFDDDSHLPYHPPPYQTHSWPTCSWIFTIDQLVGAGAFLATELNGQPLPKDQGAPVRLLVPGWYGCTEAKWVNEIKFVDDNQPATLQMQEFATRTFQPTHVDEMGKGPYGPVQARDYHPATIDQAALPVRVEAWKLDGKLAYRVVGITWGGPRRTDKLMIRFLAGRLQKFQPVNFCKTTTSNREYGIWCHHWQPSHPGPYWIEMRLADRGIAARKMSQRLQIGQNETIAYHARSVHIPSV